MLIFLSRGDLLCRLRNLRRWRLPASGSEEALRFQEKRALRALSGPATSPAVAPTAGSSSSDSRSVPKRRPTGHPAKRWARGRCVEGDSKPVLTTARRCLTFPLRVS